MPPSAHKKRQQRLRAEKYAKGSNASTSTTPGPDSVPVSPPRPASPRTIQRWRDEYPIRHQTYIDYMHSGKAKPRVPIRTPPWVEDPSKRRDYSYEDKLEWLEKNLSPEDEEVRKWREWQEEFHRLGYRDPKEIQKALELERYDTAMQEMEILDGSAVRPRYRKPATFSC